MSAIFSRITCFLFVLILEQSFLAASTRVPEAEIKSIQLEEGLHLLIAEGGNITVSTGKDGVILFDYQYTRLTKNIRAAIEEIQDSPIRFTINTHWPGYQTDGNDNPGQDRSVFVEDYNAQKRVTVSNFKEFISHATPVFAGFDQPMITFSENLELGFNGMAIKTIYFPYANKDGGSVVFFKSANVVHMGSLYFNVEGFPYIDSVAVGSVEEIIRAVNQILAEIDDDTRIIPGQGPLSNKTELVAYVEKLKIVSGRYKALIDEGKNFDEIIAANPTGDLDPPGILEGLDSPMAFLTILWGDLGKKEILPQAKHKIP